MGKYERVTTDTVYRQRMCSLLNAQRCREGVMNDFVSWCIYACYCSLHFIEMIFIRASVDALCRDDASEISRDPGTKRLLTPRERLARP